ncbi:MAG: hypothetical protein Unbinned3528contig1000_45 [Prokaryotic dsDNA virus sp.]|nr:MAG: hypothetical protein Unbinned3528contig1000_45 [Prokaryotic dsDNA virus sp.]|tara:strand:- start:18591 stop:19013 length:423 start_codon:yes stop_codon:yes gene_type:complete
MSKKKFSETKVGQFLLNKGSSLFNVVGDVLPDNGLLGVVKNLIDKDDTMPQQDKEMALELIKQDQIEMQEVTKRWVADASAGWLQANVRPLTLIFFSVAYVVGWYLDYPLESITGLLSLIVGAYFGSRGVEKVMGNNRHK